MKYDFRHIDPRTGLPKVIKNDEPEIQMMNRLPWRTGWIYLLQNRVGLNTVGNQRFKKKVWYDRRDCTVSTDETKEDAQHIRVAKFPNLGRPAGWIFASDIREFFNQKFTKSLNESKDIKDVKKGERIIFWTEDQLDQDDAWPAVGTMIFDRAGNPSQIGILDPIAHNECCGYISFDMISKWDYIDKVFPKGKTEDRLVQAISDSLVESLFFK